jgi:hypothetical protein
MSTKSIITPPCHHCKATSTVEVDENAYASWQAGELIQNAFPHMSIADREILKTGIHPQCWDILFPVIDE